MIYFLLLPATILISNKRHSNEPLNKGVRLLGVRRMSLGMLKSLVKK
jgi:hypothetical protein